MSFQSGDKIIIIKEGNYFSKEGIIEKEYKPEFNKTLGHHRWVVLFHDHPTHTRFIFQESDISPSIQYKRDEKLKSLGIK